MADAKRQSVAGGKANASKSAVAIADLTKAMGATLRVSTTISSHSLEGHLFATDPALDLIALRDSGNPGSFHIVPVSQISSFKVVTPASNEEEPFTATKVDSEALRAREAKAIADAKKAEASIGKGVTREAQEIFDHISRTLPSRWAGSQIVVSDSVIIDSPYGVENVKAPADKKQALAQIKRVVDGYWTKKVTGKSGTTTPVGNGPPARVPVPNIVRKGG